MVLPHIFMLFFVLQALLAVDSSSADVASD